MPKIDKEALYNHFAKWENDLFEILEDIPKDEVNEHVMQRLLFMREINTVTLCKHIIFDFPEAEDEKV